LMSRTVRSLANEDTVGEALIEVTNAIEQSVCIPACNYLKIISVERLNKKISLDSR
jgi:hypothetical protein